MNRPSIPPVRMRCWTVVGAALAMAWLARVVHADAIVVEGQALNAMGGGIEGAKVTVSPSDETGKPGEAIVTGTTNETGDFKLTLPEGTSDKIVVRVRAPDFKDFTQRVDLAEEAEPFVVAQLEGALELSGRVTRALTDQSVVGAKVIYRTAARSKTATTDRQGRYKLSGLQRGSGELIILAEGMAQERKPLQLTDTTTVDVKLKPEVEVTVTVVDDLGRPAAGITVEAISDEPRRSYAAVTDQRGRARLSGVHPGSSALQARLLGEEYIIPQGFDHVLDLPEWEEKVTHKLELPRPSKLEGRVVRARDGQPVGHAMVYLGPSKGRFLTSVNADSRGRFQVVGLPARRVLVTADHERFAPAIENVKLRPGSTAKVALKLPPGAPLSGVVRDAEDQPVPQAVITVEGWGAYNTLMVHTRTDERGRFLLEHMPPDGVRLAIRGEGHPRHLTGVLEPGREVHEIVLGVHDGLAAGGLGGLKVLVGATTMRGRKLDPRDVDGKFVLLHFWTASCVACKAEMPRLMAATGPYRDRNDFVVIGVSFDQDRAKAASFIEATTLPWAQLVGEPGRAKDVGKAFHVRTVPAMLLVGPEGRLLAQGLDGDRLKRELARHLGDTAPPRRPDDKPVPKF